MAEIVNGFGLYQSLDNVSSGMFVAWYEDQAAAIASLTVPGTYYVVPATQVTVLSPAVTAPSPPTGVTAA